MNREIKFRSWDNSYGEYIYFDLMSIEEHEFISHTPDDSGGCSYINKKDAEIIEQFTGLQDKNGKDIYEGDRVKIIDEIVTIFFNESMASWDYEYEGGDCEPIVPDGSYYEPSGFEVVGNIHESKN